MKKLLIYCLLFFSMLFTAGCNKNKENSEPTPAPTATSTPTPSPTPANLAKENLDQLSEQYNKLASYTPTNTIDYSNGIGYDMTLKVSLGEQIAGLLGITGLENISLEGAMDMKDSLSGNFDLFINEDKIIGADFFADSKNILFNLPAYSENYASISMEELLGTTFTSNEDFSTLFNQTEMLQLTCNYIKEFTDAFEELPEITESAQIGTGEYTVSGKKYTVRADAKKVYSIFERLMTDLMAYSGVNTTAEELEIPEPTENYLFFDFYTDGLGNYAWATYSDTEPDGQIIFVNNSVGFCLYKVDPDGTETKGMYSVKSSDKAGTISICFGEEEPMGTLDYEYDDNSLSFDGTLDTVELSMEISKDNETVRYDATVVTEGLSFIIKETATPKLVDATITFASYGVKYVTMDMSIKLRDYVEAPAPQNTVSIEAWTEALNQEALTADLVQLATDYPFLASLILGSEEENEGDFDDDWEEEPFELPEGYTDDFMSMTGYTVDSDGYVDFIPQESEVLALGKPSTGYTTTTVTDTQKDDLIDLCSGLYTNSYSDVESYYSVWGNVETGIDSYYYTEYYYCDNNDYNNFVFLDFDAISGDFIDLSIYTSTSEQAIQAATDALKILGVDVSLTKEELTNGVLAGDYVVFGYDTADGSYSINLEVYEPWN